MIRLFARHPTAANLLVADLPLLGPLPTLVDFGLCKRLRCLLPTDLLSYWLTFLLTHFPTGLCSDAERLALCVLPTSYW